LKADLAVSFAGKSRHPIREAGDGTATATELLECVNVNVSQEFYSYLEKFYICMYAVPEN